ncbi:MAG: PDZ domain-containing protein [Planctomycetota bacterium]
MMQISTSIVRCHQRRGSLLMVVFAAAGFSLGLFAPVFGVSGLLAQVANDSGSSLRNPRTSKITPRDPNQTWPDDLGSPSYPRQTPGTQKKAAPGDQIQTWVDDLGSQSYLRRTRATRELIEAGGAAVQPLIGAIQSGDLETTRRAVMVLQEIAISEPFLPTPTEERQSATENVGLSNQANPTNAADSANKNSNAEPVNNPPDETLSDESSENRSDEKRVGISFRGDAWQELNRLASTGGSRAAQATQAIQEVGEVRRVQALRTLAAANVFIGDSRFVLNARDEVKRVLQIDDSFRGPDAILDLLQWIDQIGFVRLRGSALRRNTIAGIAKMPDVKTIALVEGEIDMDSLRELGSLSRIQHLDFRYVPLTAEMVDYLATLPITISLTLNGTGAPAENVAALQRTLPGLQVEYKQGGFLGVKCIDTMNECIINEVVLGSGAATAGLRADDVIVKIDDRPIGKFADLQDAINAHVPGDEIKIEFQRAAQTLHTQARLGKLSSR